jgi:hypothetical protein
VAWISGRPWCCDGCVCWRFYGSEGSTVVHVQFEVDSPIVEKLGGAGGACNGLRFGVVQRW